MTLPLIQNLSIYQAEDATFALTLGQDITGWTLELFVTAYEDSGSQYFTEPVSITTPLTGVISLSIPSAATANMRFDCYSYYVKRTDSGHDTIAAAGLLTINQP